MLGVWLGILCQDNSATGTVTLLDSSDGQLGTVQTLELPVNGWGEKLIPDWTDYVDDLAKIRIQTTVAVVIRHVLLLAILAPSS